MAKDIHDAFRYLLPIYYLVNGYNDLDEIIVFL